MNEKRLQRIEDAIERLAYLAVKDIHEIIYDTCLDPFHEEEGSDWTPCGKCGRPRKL